MASIDSDAEYARRLQDEEIAAAGLGRSSFSGSYSNNNVGGSGVGDGGRSRSASNPEMMPHSATSSRPLLDRALSAGAGGGRGGAAGGAHRNVQLHVLDEAQQIQHDSPYIVVLYCLWGLAELIMSCVALGYGWDQACDEPLRNFLALYTARWLLLIPITLIRYKRRREFEELEGAVSDPLVKFHGWVRFASFVIMIVGQYYFFSSHTCLDTNPWIYKMTLALIVLFYVGLFLPIVLLFVMCLCLPFALIFIRIFSPKPGAKPEVISQLPKKTYHTPAGGLAPGAETPTCAICMEDYKDGDELRELPCSHDFHVPCADRWLAINHTCPLCRKPIFGAGSEPSAEAAVASPSQVHVPENVV